MRIEQLTNAEGFNLGAIRDDAFLDKVSEQPIQSISRTYQGNQTDTIEGYLTDKFGSDGFRYDTDGQIDDQISKIFTDYVPPEVKAQLTRDGFRIVIDGDQTVNEMTGKGTVVKLVDANGDVVKNANNEELIFTYEYKPQSNTNARIDTNNLSVLTGDLESSLNKIIAKANESRQPTAFGNITLLSDFVTQVAADPNFSSASPADQKAEAIRRWKNQ